MQCRSKFHRTMLPCPNQAILCVNPFINAEEVLGLNAIAACGATEAIDRPWRLASLLTEERMKERKLLTRCITSWNKTGLIPWAYEGRLRRCIGRGRHGSQSRRSCRSSHGSSCGSPRRSHNRSLSRRNGGSSWSFRWCTGLYSR